MSNTENKQNIIFIDDDERIVRTLDMMFSEEYNVFSTTDPEEYLNLIRTHHMHIAISDQRMPKRLGTELLAEVKEISPKTIRILLTGYADVKAIMSAINEGEIYRYITKPWNINELRRTIKRASEIAVSMTHETTVSAVKKETSGKDKVLILEDSEQGFSTIHRALSSQYEVIWAKNLREAYSALVKHEIAVVISDVWLNGDNIAPVIKALKISAPHLVIIVNSALEDSDQLIGLINQGQIFRCLPKPLRVISLEMSVKSAIEHHYRLKEVPSLSLAHEVERTAEVDVLATEITSKFSEILHKIKRFLGFGRGVN